ncbi:hypothetical protein PPL_02675 [Heterostelium album PN500]|uniref:Uncharacterized protein n=1 Tax=Heterostelium pallidum (strain ATCC 26659 / Pp 5 / PN500) TaxID=670386 RepID=D3B2R1_HETP5|nr:hypothetical protein PPL_02675 [Heterostelium album PN500]EFA83609.1 hypothetical protein PPL_02675 [Heterostelium album PN500]|eukprot:XP_020435726.1 hypothetical protein PPL_02675 [Heterostelium album PN500]
MSISIHLNICLRIEKNTEFQTTPYYFSGYKDGSALQWLKDNTTMQCSEGAYRYAIGKSNLPVIEWIRDNTKELNDGVQIGDELKNIKVQCNNQRKRLTSSALDNYWKDFDSRKSIHNSVNTTSVVPHTLFIDSGGEHYDGGGGGGLEEEGDYSPSIPDKELCQFSDKVNNAIKSFESIDTTITSTFSIQPPISTTTTTTTTTTASTNHKNPTTSTESTTSTTTTTSVDMSTAFQLHSVMLQYQSDRIHWEEESASDKQTIDSTRNRSHPVDQPSESGDHFCQGLSYPELIKFAILLYGQKVTNINGLVYGKFSESNYYACKKDQVVTTKLYNNYRRCSSCIRMQQIVYQSLHKYKNGRVLEIKYSNKQHVKSGEQVRTDQVAQTSLGTIKNYIPPIIYYGSSDHKVLESLSKQKYYALAMDEIEISAGLLLPSFTAVDWHSKGDYQFRQS